MAYIRITKDEYERLLRYRDIVGHIREEVNEETNVKQISDPAAIRALKKLRLEVRKGKRKLYSLDEVRRKYPQAF